MHSAPPVLVPVGRFVWGARITWILAAVSLLAWMVWCAQAQAGAGQIAVVLLFGCAVGMLSLWALQCQGWPAGQLQWDGEAWRFQPEPAAAQAQAVQVQAVWDGGVAMCLRLTALRDGTPQGAAVGYAWLSHRDMPRVWHGLRCAVYQRDTL